MEQTLKLLHNAMRGPNDVPGKGNADCGYSGLVLMPDGSFLAMTYVRYRSGENQHSVVSTRFHLRETDALYAQSSE